MKFLKKKQESRGLLSNLTGIKASIISDLPIINTFLKKYKRSAIVNKFLLAEDKFMPEMHLTQPGFTYDGCGIFNRNKERIKKIKKQEIPDIFIQIN